MIRIALLQMNPCGNDTRANLEKGEQFCRRAAERGADIALFPEMWNIGYTFFDAKAQGARERWAAQALARDDAFVHHFQSLARELHIAIALTYLERGQFAPRNALSLIDARGEILFTYAKVHTCDFDAERALEDGKEFFVADLETRAGSVRVGAMICFDREFPESARVLMLRGAEIILVPNACAMEINRLTQLRARAFENMTAIALTNYAAPRENGHSVAFDGMAFDEHEGSRDMCVLEADARQEIFIAEIDLAKLRAYRNVEAMGNAFRKPRAYADLVSLRVDAPFQRAEARR
jgi:predicted amidohydrolase